ncbi:MAG: hypothetical protein GXP63_06985 [DPANN group archaeon]|nr:hypothetical protein [DPANN group archaeon]
MTQFGIKEGTSLLLGVLLVVFGLLPQFGIRFITLPGRVWPGVLLASLIFLIIDGFGEQHMLRTLTLLSGLLVGLYLALPMANNAGWIGFGIPTWSLLYEGYVQGLCGVLLIIGSVKT